MDENIDEEDIIEENIDEESDSIPESYEDDISDYNTTHADNYEKAGQIQHELGTQALQEMGVPEPFAKIAAKNNGGPLSPHNTPLDRKVKKAGQNSIANMLDKTQGNANNSSDKLNMANRLNQSYNLLNEYRNRSRSNSASGESSQNSVNSQTEKSGVNNLVQNVASKAIGSKRGATNGGSGTVIKLINSSKNVKMAIGAALGLLIFLIIFAPVFGSDSSGSADTAQSEEMTDYLYGSGDTKQLYKKLIDMGLCDTEDECSKTEAAAFYIKLEEKISSYDNTTKKIAANFIIEMTGYDRGDYTDEYEKGRYDTLDEIDYLGDIILANSSLTEDSIKDYKEEIIKDGGYFETYRPELLEEGKDNKDLKSEIFDNVIDSVLTNVEGIDISSNIVSNGVCGYNVNGESVSNVKVQLLECSGKTPIEGEELVDFDKYILGVTYAENSYPENGAKTEAIAARSYALLRHDAMRNSLGIKLEKKDDYWLLSIRNCTQDQVYCDPDRGCWGEDGTTDTTVHSGTDSNGTKIYKGVLAQDAPLRKWVAEVNGMVAVNEDGTVKYTPYKSKIQKKWNAYAEAGDDYATIIKKHYGVSVSSTCSNTYATGDFTSWKQGDANWGNITLGNTTTTIHKAGCLITSVSIQLAKSGVPTSLSVLNPGTVVQALNTKSGFAGDEYVWNSITQIAPRFVLVEHNHPLTGTRADKAAELKRLADSGYYVVIRAKSDQHWVALDRVDGETVYMHDPASDAISLWDRYSNDSDVTRCAIYKVQ